MGAPFWAVGQGRLPGFDGAALDEGVYPPNPFDLCRIKGLYLPGVAKVKALPTQDYKAEKAPGRDGATIILQGYLPGPIDIELLMWLPEQWLRWQRVLTEIWRKPGKLSAGFSDRGTQYEDGKAKKQADARAISKGEVLATEQAVTIETPSLQPYNITRVVVTGVSPPEPGPVSQSRIVNIKCLEWVPPPPPKPQSKRVKSSTNKPKPDASIFDIPAANSASLSPGENPAEGGPSGPPTDPNAGKI